MSGYGEARNALLRASVYAGTGRHGDRSRPKFWGVRVVQISRPRDLGALVFVIGLFLILLVVTLVVGGPQR
jgi:hypothetical protein